MSAPSRTEGLPSARHISMWKGSTLASEAAAAVSSMVCGGRRGWARATPARLSVDAMGMASVGATQTGEALSSEAFSQLSVSDRVGSIPRRISFADGSIASRRATMTASTSCCAPIAGRAQDGCTSSRNSDRGSIVFVALVLAFSVAIYRFAVPALVEVAVLSTPPVVPQLMSRERARLARRHRVRAERPQPGKAEIAERRISRSSRR